MTLRDLLNHTSGIHNFTEGPVIDKISTSGATVNELVADIASQSPLYDFEPGNGWWYSNSNYALLGAVIEKVSGETWAAFMKVEIFDKLGMADTAADDARDVIPGRASGYSLIGGVPGKFRNVDFTDMSVPYAAGALRSTAEDMARWNAALFGGKLLKPKSLTEMLAPGRLRNGAETQTAIAWPGGKASRRRPATFRVPTHLASTTTQRTAGGHHRPRRLDRRIRRRDAEPMSTKA